jgi:hypothetical protein
MLVGLERTKSYATFNLGRIQAVQRAELVEAHEPEMADTGWNKLVALRVQAHSRLSAAAERAVRRSSLMAPPRGGFLCAGVWRPSWYNSGEWQWIRSSRHRRITSLELANAEEVKKGGVDFAHDPRRERAAIPP